MILFFGVLFFLKKKKGITYFPQTVALILPNQKNDVISGVFVGFVSLKRMRGVYV